MKTSKSCPIILSVMGLLLLSSCTYMSFQERTIKAQKEICEYSFERCSLERLEMLAAAINHRGKIYFFTREVSDDYGNTFQIADPSFEVKINPDSDAVCLLNLIHEAEKSWVTHPQAYPGLKVIYLDNTERTIFNELQKYIDENNKRILTRDPNFYYIFTNVNGEKCYMPDNLFPLHLNNLCPNDNYIYKNKYKSKYAK